MKRAGWLTLSAGGVLLALAVYVLWPATRGPEPTTAPVAADGDDNGVGLGVAYAEEAGGGRFRPARTAPAADESDENASAVRQLTALPYFAGTAPAPEHANVALHDADRTWTGLNLYTSGHAPAAFVMDMDGRVLHEWRYDIMAVWPELAGDAYSAFWRRAYWYPNGDLLAIFEGLGMLRLDRSSRLLWAFPGGCHHQACVTADGRIHVLTRERHMLPRFATDRELLEDRLAILTADGILVDEFSLVECFENSEFGGFLHGPPPHHGDLLHVNSVFVCDGRQATQNPLYRAGNVLISALVPSMVAMVDPRERRVIWAVDGVATGLWRRQHDAVVLPGGSIQVFDNHPKRGPSRIVEFDPLTLRVIWMYAGADADDFFTRTCGTSQRLPNGNTLITESDNGRAFEVTPAGATVWEFYNPHRAGAQDELIATLFELRRVPADYFPWLTPVD